jgi:predicted transcriptional regulator
MDEPTVNVYRLGSEGLARLFGELEAQIMEVLWLRGEATVPTVVEALGPRVQYTTAQTVMTRLAEKGVLTRRLLTPGGAYLYAPSQERETFLARVASQLVSSLLADFGEAAVTGLVDAVDRLPPDQLAALEAVIRARRSAGSA